MKLIPLQEQSRAWLANALYGGGGGNKSHLACLEYNISSLALYLSRAPHAGEQVRCVAQTRESREMCIVCSLSLSLSLSACLQAMQIASPHDGRQSQRLSATQALIHTATVVIPSTSSL